MKRARLAGLGLLMLLSLGWSIQLAIAGHEYPYWMLLITLPAAGLFGWFLGDFTLTGRRLAVLQAAAPTKPPSISGTPSTFFPAPPCASELEREQVVLVLENMLAEAREGKFRRCYVIGYGVSGFTSQYSWSMSPSERDQIALASELGRAQQSVLSIMLAGIDGRV